MKKRRVDRIDRHVSSVPRFATGMLMLPPCLLVEGLVPKVILVAYFSVLAVLAGKKIRWGYFLILVLSVTFFHLLAPWGRVLVRIGPFAVTSGALENGLTRGSTLVGIVFLSLATVSSGLKIPGSFGGLSGRTFFYFEALVEGEKRLSRKNFFASLDILLTECFNPDQEKIETTDTIPQQVKGWFVAIPALFLPWFLLLRSILLAHGESIS